MKNEVNKNPEDSEGSEADRLTEIKQKKLLQRIVTQLTNLWLARRAANPFQRFTIFTVSPHHKDQRSLLLLNMSIEHIFLKYKHVDSMIYVQETSDAGKLHIHGIICHRNDCKWMKVRKHPVYNYHFDTFKPSGGWLHYMGKDSPKYLYKVHRDKSEYTDFIYSKDNLKKISLAIL